MLVSLVNRAEDIQECYVPSAWYHVADAALFSRPWLHCTSLWRMAHRRIPTVNQVLSDFSMSIIFPVKYFMARSAEDRMFALIRQWQGSGMTQKDFCVKKSIVYATFLYWYKKFRDADHTDKPVPSFVPVTMPVVGSSSFCTVHLAGGIQIDFHAPVPPAYLNQLGN